MSLSSNKLNTKKHSIKKLEASAQSFKAKEKNSSWQRRVKQRAKRLKNKSLHGLIFVFQTACKSNLTSEDMNIFEDTLLYQIKTRRQLKWPADQLKHVDPVLTTLNVGFGCCTDWNAL